MKYSNDEFINAMVKAMGKGNPHDNLMMIAAFIKTYSDVVNVSVLSILAEILDMLAEVDGE